MIADPSAATAATPPSQLVAEEGLDAGVDRDTMDEQINAVANEIDEEKDEDEYTSIGSGRFSQDDITDSSPKGRFLRFKEVLSASPGAEKVVYSAYDTLDGVECAWNEIDTSRMTKEERQKLQQELDVISKLRHKHVIDYHNKWRVGTEKVVYITEIMPTGSLKDFIRRVEVVRWKAVKRWCRQILKGLHYLHDQTPKIIHRDLKCANIFINGASGDIVIGELGLFTLQQKQHSGIVGTPGYMAPEQYEDTYDEKVDIFAFGMCVLEMITKESPYAELGDDQFQIFLRVTNNWEPEGISRVPDGKARAFIRACLRATNRPSAAELLTHPFFRLDNEELDDTVVWVEPRSPASSLPTEPSQSQMSLPSLADVSQSPSLLEEANGDLLHHNGDRRHRNGGSSDGDDWEPAGAAAAAAAAAAGGDESPAEDLPPGAAKEMRGAAISVDSVDGETLNFVVQGETEGEDVISIAFDFDLSSDSTVTIITGLVAELQRRELEIKRDTVDTLTHQLESFVALGRQGLLKGENANAAAQEPQEEDGEGGGVGGEGAGAPGDGAGLGADGAEEEEEEEDSVVYDAETDAELLKLRKQMETVERVHQRKVLDFAGQRKAEEERFLQAVEALREKHEKLQARIRTKEEMEMSNFEKRHLDLRRQIADIKERFRDQERGIRDQEDRILAHLTANSQGSGPAPPEPYPYPAQAAQGQLPLDHHGDLPSGPPSF